MTPEAAATLEAAAMQPMPRLDVRGLSKSFGGIRALREVSLHVASGSVHALLGENGAGKSTLVKIATGLEQPDAGEVRLDGVLCRFASPMEARRAGIVAVYQDPKMFPHLSVAENIFMGIFPVGRLGTIDRAGMHQRARALLTSLDSHLDPSALIAGLSVGDLQFVEFARALADRADRVLFLDEPTASLSPAETQRLFRVIRRMREAGTAVVIISHRLEELRELVDTVTVLRDGTHILTAPASNLSDAEIVRAMVGRTLGQASRTRFVPPDAPIRLSVQGLSLTGTFSNVSFEVRAGEIVGIFGLVGAGRTEIAQALFGITPPEQGRLTIDGREVQPRSPRQMLAAGLAYVPEDRERQGLVSSYSVRKNLTVAVLHRLARWGVLRPAREVALALRTVAQLSIRTNGTEAPVASLSGGNRQKVVLGKWLAIGPKVLVLDEPTHGIDVGAKAQVHAIVAELAARGVAVLLISSDLPEVLAISDRILVVAGGRIVARFDHATANEVAVLAAASGLRAAA
jgi:rhamnose transport system ATP-binding protein